MLGVGRREERAFVVIKPPCDVRRAGVLEVDDGILVAIELFFVEQRSRSMDETCKFKIDICPNTFAVKAGEQCRRGSSIKTLVVIKDPNSHCVPRFVEIPAK